MSDLTHPVILAVFVWAFAATEAMEQIVSLHAGVWAGLTAAFLLSLWLAAVEPRFNGA